MKRGESGRKEQEEGMRGSLEVMGGREPSQSCIGWRKIVIVLCMQW